MGLQIYCTKALTLADGLSRAGFADSPAR